jgi:hypothetical protein
MLMRLIVPLLAFSATSVFLVIVVIILSTVMGQPFTLFQCTTTFLLIMMACWLPYIAVNTNKSK